MFKYKLQWQRKSFLVHRKYLGLSSIWQVSQTATHFWPTRSYLYRVNWLYLFLSRHTFSVQQWCHPPRLICHPAAWAHDGFSEFSRTQETRQYLTQVADQSCEETEQWQGGRPCKETRTQAQEEPCRRAQEHRSGLAERLRRQRCYTTGRDCGRGQTRLSLPLTLRFIMLVTCLLLGQLFLPVNMCHGSLYRGWGMKDWAVAHSPNPPLRVCRAVVRKRERRALTLCPSLHQWPSNSTVSSNLTLRTTRWTPWIRSDLGWWSNDLYSCIWV